LGNDKLLKYGPSAEIELEAENMRYIAANTTIPIPHIHDIGNHNSGIKSIVMDYIDSHTLQDIWLSMLPSQKMFVAEQLRGYVLQLRDLPFPEPIGHQIDPVDIYSLDITRNPERQVRLTEQPFTRMTTLNIHILQRHASGKRKEKLAFTHGDLAPRNILVNDYGQVTAVLDWEYAGWYPQWWESVKAYQFCNDVPDWKAYLSAILPPDHETEYMAVAFSRHF
jgi:aminoglycoside phosphotransferase (APT) family kinase protein